jgi:hypothetical protein
MESISEIAFEPREEILRASPELEGEKYPRYFKPEAKGRSPKFHLAEPEWISEMGSNEKAASPRQERPGCPGITCRLLWDFS